MLFNETGNVYSRQRISDAEARIGLTRKRGPVTAAQATAPANLHRRWCFFHCAYPIGVLGTPRHLLVDFDECGIYLQTTNRSYGKAARGRRFVAPQLPCSSLTGWLV